MNITTISSREFNQDLSKAKRSSLKGPVFITDRGKPAHVLLSMSDYNNMMNHHDSIVDLIGIKNDRFINLPDVKLPNKLFKPVVFD